MTFTIDISQTVGAGAFVYEPGAGLLRPSPACRAVLMAAGVPVPGDGPMRLDRLAGCVHPEDAPRFERILESDQPDCADVRLTAPTSGQASAAAAADGLPSEVWLRIAVDPTMLPAGQVAVAVRDVTAERAGAMRMLDSERKYRSLFENAPVGIFHSTLSGRFLLVNNAMAQIYGYPSPEAMQREIHSIPRQQYADADDRERLLDLLRVHGEVLGFETLMKKRGGGYVWTSRNIRVIKDDSGEIAMLEGFVTDISDRKQTERAIRQAFDSLERLVQDRTEQLRTANEQLTQEVEERGAAEEYLRQAHAELDLIFNSIDDGMCLIAPDFTVVSANAALLRMFGVVDTARDLACADIFGEDSCCMLRQAFGRILTGEKRVEMDISRHTNEDERHAIWSMVPYGSEGELQGVLLTVKDITDRVVAEREAKARERLLIQADKLSALGTLVAGVAHEINNPTGIISLNAPLLKRYWASASELLDERRAAEGDFSLGGVPYAKLRERIPYLFDQIMESAGRIRNIVMELKDFSRQDQGGVRQSVDLNKVLRGAVGLASGKIKSCSDNFRLRYAKQELRVQGSFHRLEQVVVNALINACEALTDSQQAIDVSLVRDMEADMAEIRVADEGRGMDKDDLNKIFEPFYTTKRDMGGTGLGLSVSIGIVSEHGGELLFASTPGEGTVCRIRLPLDSASVDIDEPSPTDMEPNP